MCLTDEQESRFDEWIAKRNVACPICHGRQFVHLEPAMEPRFSIDLGRHVQGGAASRPTWPESNRTRHPVRHP